MGADEIRAVLGGSRRWAVCEADCLDWLRGLPSGAASLCLFSPPYEAARTYGVGFGLTGQAWVDWLAERVVEMARVTDGLVLCNAAGQVRRHSYSPVVEWLVADLTRRHGLVCGPAPYCYFRFGIPGSGGQRYHRRDWEPVYAFCRPEVLPLRWSDNTAEGHPPRWAPGGEMSNRLSSGQRVNQWGPTGARKGVNRKKTGARDTGERPSHETSRAVDDTAAGLFGPLTEAPGVRDNFGCTSSSSRRRTGSGRLEKMTKKVYARRPDGSRPEDEHYAPPAVANPGNVVREKYDAEQVRQVLDGLQTRELDQGDVVRCLVGGGAMGSRIAHENEAPYPERLAEFFVRSYAPPRSVVMDPFSGSGTTGAVAVALGRRFVGCDVRASQVELSRRRVAASNPPLPFAE